jgi:hypothetical protein
MQKKKATEYVGKKRRSCIFNLTLPAGNTRNTPTCVWQFIRSVNTIWRPPSSGIRSLKYKSENYSSGQFRLYGNVESNPVWLPKMLQRLTFCLIRPAWLTQYDSGIQEFYGKQKGLSLQEWRHSSTTPDLGTRCRWVVSFTIRPLYPQVPIWQEVRWAPRVSLDAVKKGEVPTPCREANPGRQALSL